MHSVFLVAESGGLLSSWGAWASFCGGFPCGARTSGCMGFSSLWLTGSIVVAWGLPCSAVCGIFPDQESSPCTLHCKADSQPLDEGGLLLTFLNAKTFQQDGAGVQTFTSVIPGPLYLKDGGNSHFLFSKSTVGFPLTLWDLYWVTFSLHKHWWLTLCESQLVSLWSVLPEWFFLSFTCTVQLSWQLLAW